MLDGVVICAGLVQWPPFSSMPGGKWWRLNTVSLNRRFAVHHRIKGSSAVRITEVSPDTPATRAGLRVGDVIVKADDLPVVSLDDLLRVLGRHVVGEKLAIQVIRDGEPLTLDAYPTELPDAA